MVMNKLKIDYLGIFLYLKYVLIVVKKLWDKKCIFFEKSVRWNLRLVSLDCFSVCC